jgi:hypothetical protein
VAVVVEAAAAAATVDADRHTEVVEAVEDMAVTAVAAATSHEAVAADTVVEVEAEDKHIAHTRRGAALRCSMSGGVGWNALSLKVCSGLFWSVPVKRPSVRWAKTSVTVWFADWLGLMERGYTQNCSWSWRGSQGGSSLSSVRFLLRRRVISSCTVGHFKHLTCTNMSLCEERLTAGNFEDPEAQKKSRKSSHSLQHGEMITERVMKMMFVY